MEFLHAIIVLSNFVVIPAIAYGSQLALGALGVTLVYGILRFSNFAHGDTMASNSLTRTRCGYRVPYSCPHLREQSPRRCNPVLWLGFLWRGQT